MMHPTFMDIIERFQRLRTSAPDLGGADFALERGWITDDQYQAELATAAQIWAQEEVLAATLARAAQDDPGAWRTCLELLHHICSETRAGARTRATSSQRALMEDAHETLEHIPLQPDTLSTHQLWAIWVTWDLRDVV